MKVAPVEVLIRQLAPDLELGPEGDFLAMHRSGDPEIARP